MIEANSAAGAQDMIGIYAGRAMYYDGAGNKIKRGWTLHVYLKFNGYKSGFGLVGPLIISGDGWLDRKRYVWWKWSPFVFRIFWVQLILWKRMND